MPTDRFLTSVLQTYQNSPDSTQIDRILSSTTSLLTTLSNPLNICLLTSNFLIAPAVWPEEHDLHLCFRIVSVFNTAAIAVRKHHLDGRQKPYDAYQPRLGGGLDCDKWTRAVLRGLDDRSPRWKHILVIAGVLLGMEGQKRRGLSPGLRAKLEMAMVTATNLTLQDKMRKGLLEAGSIALAISHTFPLLSEKASNGLDFGKLSMVILTAMTSTEGYQNARILALIDQDIRSVGPKLDWSAESNSFLELQKVASKPLVLCMGLLSRVVACCIEHMSDPLLILEIRTTLLAFTEQILRAWKLNRFSGIDPADEATSLTESTFCSTIPALWQVFKGNMLTIIVILRAISARTLIDPMLSTSRHAPATATQLLLTLRNIHFISSRFGSSTFSAYTFVNLTSIDILTRYPTESRTLLRLIHNSQSSRISSHPLQRNLDLFYLNTAEHFPFTLSPADCEELIIVPSSPYINPTANPNMLQIFEAAHSAMLATLAAPLNADLTAKVLPFYIESLFRAFPTNLSPQQFRYAFKALAQITTPPSPVFAAMPELAETLLEVLFHRAMNASQAPLPPSLPTKIVLQDHQQSQPHDQPTITERAVLLLSLLDALPYLPLPILETWLPLSADLLYTISDQRVRAECRERFWEVLESGEMDIERAAAAVRWWTTREGREMVLFGEKRKMEEMVAMSGGLGDVDRRARL